MIKTIYLETLKNVPWSSILYYSLIHRMITKQRVKSEQIERKQTCSVSFVKVFKFQESKFKIVQNSFKIEGNNKKDLLENPPVMMIII